jgi:hypothetical protein
MMGMMFGRTNIRGLHLRGNVETCPRCGGLANIADGVFDIAGDVVTAVTAPRMTTAMLAALSSALRKAYEEKKQPEEVAKDVEVIDPALAALIRKNVGFWPLVVILVMLAIKSCSLNIALDANRLLDQLLNVSSPAVFSSPEPPPPAAEPPKPAAEPTPDEAGAPKAP